MDLTNPSGDSTIPHVVNQMETSLDGRINWGDYNFPPCIRMVHFSLGELQGGLRSFVARVYLTYLLLISILLINCNYFFLIMVVLSTIIQVAKYSSAINIFYTFLSNL
eukprot:TRINITY_DN7774_c0_g1_i6.p1 TRINITY_DN7774_c0_g1~~TRINITY_DN7774_c0_g1_i6.p1  ORF type:complete len:108 (-),score=18.56 TRINITY_DN7774_c0_g1_i6:251-574(-)